MTHCPRCRSLLLSEPITERDTNDLGRTIYLQRCPCCGFYTDPLAEANRAHPETVGTRELRPGFYRLTNKEFRRAIKTPHSARGTDQARYKKALGS